MESANNPNFLDSQYPNLIDTKKFGFPASSPPMPAGTDSEADIALRCRALVRLYAKDADGTPVAKLFAAQVGCSPTQWGNIVRSGKLSREVARYVYRKYPIVSLDWLYRGDERGMGPTQTQEFLDAYLIELARAGEPKPETPPKPKRQKASKKKRAAA